MRIRKIGIMATVIALVMMISSIGVFADTNDNLKIVETYPVDGQKNTTIENMSIKLTFNKSMGDKKYIKKNKDCFKIVDDKGKSLPIGVYYNPSNNKQVLVLVDMVKLNKIEEKTGDKIIKDKSQYTVTISSDLRANDGSKLEKKEKIMFTTLNQTWNTRIYMIMMGVMMVGMFAFTAYQSKKTNEKENANNPKKETFNPYKEAKRTGKPVEEIIAKHEKEEAKRKQKQAKKKVEEDFEDEELEEGHYRVSRPRPIREAGSKFVTGRKAEAEERKAKSNKAKKKKGKK